jgi:hypothetical protein
MAGSSLPTSGANRVFPVDRLWIGGGVKRERAFYEYLICNGADHVTVPAKCRNRARGAKVIWRIRNTVHFETHLHPQTL